MIHVLLVNDIRLMCDVLTAALDDEPDIKVVGCATSLKEALEKLICKSDQNINHSVNN